MTQKKIDRIISNVSFSMAVEGFQVTDQQKADWRLVLEGKKNGRALKADYIANAYKLAEEYRNNRGQVEERQPNV